MVLTRRRALQFVGAAAAASVAGCSSDETLDTDSDEREYSLRVDPMSLSPIEDALYEPDGGDALFGGPARTALAAILPDGRYTTDGYESVPADRYVAHAGSYYQTKHIVTGRTEMAQTLVRVDEVAREAVPEDTVVVDSLERADARVIKILHSFVRSDGEASSADLLRGDAYVLRRPVEREGKLAAGELDGRVVTMTDSGAWAYRVQTTRERITETAHTALAVEVAASRAQFRDVVFGSRVDAELTPSDLSAASRSALADAIAGDSYRETTPLSPAFEALLDALGVATVDRLTNGRRLWYDGDYYRYALSIDDTSS